MIEVHGPRLLVVEDDRSLREALRSRLGNAGYHVLAFESGLRLEEALASLAPDLAVLDVNLPVGPTGLELARRIREHGDLPILFLSAADAPADRLAGFRAGGDDYVVKPFEMAELLARITALLRRAGRLGQQTLRLRDLDLDLDRRRARRNGVDLDLTRTEFDLLTVLVRNHRQVLSKTQLLQMVWNFDAYDTNLVEVHVSSLRRKLSAAGPPLISTVRGFGYTVDG